MRWIWMACLLLAGCGSLEVERIACAGRFDCPTGYSCDRATGEARGTCALAVDGADDDDDDDAGVDDDDAADDDDAGVDDDDAADDDDAGVDDDDTTSATDADGDGVPASSDCDDSDPANFPGNFESCDGQDNDCDGLEDAGSPGVGGQETDDDGDGESECAGDCDDGDASNSSAGSEACDGQDNDCDGATWAPGGEVDSDGDGSLSCADCDDGDPLRSPDFAEGTASANCSDGIDNDCDSAVDSDPECPAATCLSVAAVQGMDLVHLCSGAFEMGCTSGQSSCGSDESPTVTVTLTNDFELGRTEVTQGQWTALMSPNPNPSQFSSCGANCPVERVNWWEALAFANAMSAAEGLPACYTLTGCNSNAPGADMECTGVTVNSAGGAVYGCEGYRLPTEAEWEFGARGGEDLLYSGSDTLSDVGWYSSNSGSTPHPVDTAPQSNAFGLSDMSGNVWEWVEDWYGSSYYSSSPGTDPLGPSTGSNRVFRGGSWSSPAADARVAYRFDFDPGYRYGILGFRLARTVP